MTPRHLRRADLVWRVVRDEVILVDLRRSEYLAVNATGVDLWTALADGASLADLSRHLVEQRNLSPANAERHARRFLLELEEQGLLDPPDSGPA